MNKKLTKFSALTLALALGVTSISTTSFASTNVIGLEKAKEIAVKDAGLLSSAVTFIKAKLDSKDNEYDIEFRSGDKKYDYEINATSGAIVDKDVEIKKSKTTNSTLNKKNTANAASTNQVKTTTNNSKYIGITKAKDIALKDAGLNASDVTFVKAKFDLKSKEYDIEFISGNKEYDYEIDAVSGQILEKDFEIEKTATKTTTKTTNTQNTTNANNASTKAVAPANQKSTSASNTSKYIGLDKAKEIALKDAGLSASAVTFTKAKLDADDNEYDIEFISGNKEYEYEISATSGVILDKDIETIR